MSFVFIPESFCSYWFECVWIYGEIYTSHREFGNEIILLGTEKEDMPGEKVDGFLGIMPPFPQLKVNKWYLQLLSQEITLLPAALQGGSTVKQKQNELKLTSSEDWKWWGEQK